MAEYPNIDQPAPADKRPTADGHAQLRHHVADVVHRALGRTLRATRLIDELTATIEKLRPR